MFHDSYAADQSQREGRIAKSIAKKWFKDLADNLGNFVNRILKFAASRIDRKIPSGGTLGESEQRLEANCKELMDTIRTYLHNLEFRKAADTLCTLWTVGNQYIDAQ